MAPGRFGNFTLTQKHIRKGARPMRDVDIEYTCLKHGTLHRVRVWHTVLKEAIADLVAQGEVASASDVTCRREVK